MKLFFVFICLLPLSLPDDNADANQHISPMSYGNERVLERHPKQLLTIKKKKIDCKTLHLTEKTPWVAIILNKESGRFICFGSIIDERHILTAYTCIENRDPLTFKILFGYFSAYWGRHSEVIMVHKFHKHEQELVILELKRVIPFSKRMKPIKLLELEEAPKAETPQPGLGDLPITHEWDKDFPGQWADIKDVLVVGFPLTSSDPLGDMIQKDLLYSLKADTVEPPTGCSDDFLPKIKLDKGKYDKNQEKRFYCLKGSSQFCWGSLGSPVIDKKTMKQVGIVAKVKNEPGCEKEDKKIFVVRVDIYINWIREHSLYV